jgi:ATP-binding cassette subfamily B protein RaxB
MLDLRILRSARVNYAPQNEVSECGLACLVMIASFYRLDIDLIDLRRRFPQSLQGTGLKDLIEIANSLDLSPRAVKVPLDHIQSLRLPAIVHWDLNHYVVIERIKRDRALVHDPASGSMWMPIATLSNHFTGVALELLPGPNFVPKDMSRKLKLSDLWNQLTGFLGSAGQVILLSIFIEAFLLVLPYFTQIAIDTILPSSDDNLLFVLGVSFGIFVLLSSFALALRGVITTSLGAQLGFGISVNVGQRLSRLPLNWFEKRRVGDVLSRFLSVVPIQKTLTDGALVAIIDGCLACATLVMMFFYSTKLTLITIAATLIYVIIRAVVVSKLKVAQEFSLTARAKEQTFLIESIQGVSSIRLGGIAAYRHGIWQSHLAHSINADIRVARLSVWQNSANFAIFGIENIAVIAFGMSEVIFEQDLTVGMLMAFVAYKNHFVSKAGSLLDQLLAMNLLSLHLGRLSDITQSDEDPIFQERLHASTTQSIQIEMKDVSFSYVEGAAPIVSGINLKIEAGEHLALSGASGMGKSTIVKLLLGVIKPTSGQILVNGAPINQFGYRNLHAVTAAVTQDDKLLNGTIRDNIAFFDNSATMESIASAAMAASLHAEVLAFPMQYETLVGEMGSALSSGQRQRMLIARALYRKPRLLIMDEGTANVDEANEDKIFQWLRLTGASMLVISHKPSTIARAERVVHIQDGVIVTPAHEFEPGYEQPD